MGRGAGEALIVLDTHAWLWWCDDPKRLSRRAQREIERHEAIGVSAISCWELAMLERKDRLRFDRGVASWVRQAIGRDDTVLIPVTTEIATRGGEVYAGVPEPADALIYATAVVNDASLVTRDRVLHDHDPARVVW